MTFSISPGTSIETLGAKELADVERKRRNDGTEFGGPAALLYLTVLGH